MRENGPGVKHSIQFAPTLFTCIHKIGGMNDKIQKAKINHVLQMATNQRAKRLYVLFNWANRIIIYDSRHAQSPAHCRSSMCTMHKLNRRVAPRIEHRKCSHIRRLLIGDIPSTDAPYVRSAFCMCVRACVRRLWVRASKTYAVHSTFELFAICRC